MFGLPKLEERLGRLLAVAVVGLTASVANPAAAADLKEVRFSEAVHNLGYINLYVGMHAGIFEKNGLKMIVTAAGGDTQTFAAVLGGSADFAIGDATMVQMSREAGGPGVVVGTVVQRAHYFGVSKNLEPITDPTKFKGLTIVTSPEPNTNYSVAKRMLENAGLKIGQDVTILQVNPGTEIGAMLAGQADMAIAYQPSVASAVDQGAKVVFDFSNYVGPFCNTGIMVLPSTIERDPEMVQALVTSFEEASRLTYSDPALRQEGGAARISRPARRGGRRGDRRRAAVQDPGAVRGYPGGPVEEPDGHADLPRQREGIASRWPRSSTIPLPRRRSSRSAAEAPMLQQAGVDGGPAGGGAFRPAAGRGRRAQGLRRWLARGAGHRRPVLHARRPARSSASSGRRAAARPRCLMSSPA